MEITRGQAVEILRRWKQDSAPLALHFAARGGTAGASLLARLTEVSSGLVFRSDSAVLRFGLYGARFALGPTQLLLAPSRAGLAKIEGLHIWLESGHWLFVCDAKKLGTQWLESGLLPQPDEGGPESLLAPGERSGRAEGTANEGAPVPLVRREEGTAPGFFPRTYLTNASEG